jgi:hypothetical protein
MRALLAAILLAGVATPAAAEEWYYVTDDGGGIVYADADSVRQAGEAVAVRGFFGSFGPMDDAEVPLWYAISQFEFICSNGQYRVTHTDSYDANHNLARSTDEFEEWASVPAESLAWYLRQFACDGVRLEAVPNPFDDTDAYFDTDL